MSPPFAQEVPKTPQLPAHLQQWSARSLAARLGVSTSTVKYHARQAFRGHNGRWKLSREQAQRIVDRISCFGHAETLSHLSQAALCSSMPGNSVSGNHSAAKSGLPSAFRSAPCAPTRASGASARTPPAVPPAIGEKTYEDH